MPPCYPTTRLLRLVVLWASVLLGGLAFAETATPKTTFDVAGGDAAETLRQLARQARESVVFPIDRVQGVQTYIATNFLGHGTVNPKANESDD